MELIAPPSWRCVDFISDLHLHASDPQTFVAWEDYLKHTAADAVFILGDLFEVWIGDDCLYPGSFEQLCADVLKQVTPRITVYVMHGNRDFLLGPAFMRASGCIILPDATVLALGNDRWILTHGDHLCLEDTAYQDFRKVVRSTQWQGDFLTKPLADRKTIADGIRKQSEGRKRALETYADADTAASVNLMESNAAQCMIHGHTHKPRTHKLPSGRSREVLSDWDLRVSPPRYEVLRIERNSMNHWKTDRLSPRLTAKNLHTP